MDGLAYAPRIVAAVTVTCALFAPTLAHAQRSDVHFWPRPESWVRFRADEPLTLYRWLEPETVSLMRGRSGVGGRGRWVPLCTAPCDFDLLAGVHRLALSRRGVPIEIQRPRVLPEGLVTIVGRYEPAAALHVYGGALALLLGVAGLAIAYRGATHPQPHATLPLVSTGAIAVALSAGVWVWVYSVGDEAAVRVVPGF